jgi:hypothetical protein
MKQSITIKDDKGKERTFSNIKEKEWPDESWY